MRPEVLESNFYAWRYTGDVGYYYRAVSAYQSFEKYLKTANINAFAPINNVNAADGGGFIDDMESFWFAEVLKYLYLTFETPTTSVWTSVNFSSSLPLPPPSPFQTATNGYIFRRLQHRGTPLRRARCEAVVWQWQAARDSHRTFHCEPRRTSARQPRREDPRYVARGSPVALSNWLMKCKN